MKSKQILLTVAAGLVFASAIIFFIIINAAFVASHDPISNATPASSSANLPDLISWIRNVNTNCGYVDETCLCSLSFNAAVKNIGMGQAGSSITRISLVGNYDVTTMVTTPTLEPNQIVTTYLVVPGSFPAGNYTLSSYADWYYQVQESNENNNNFFMNIDAHC